MCAEVSQNEPESENQRIGVRIRGTESEPEILRASQVKLHWSEQM